MLSRLLITCSAALPWLFLLAACAGPQSKRNVAVCWLDLHGRMQAQGNPMGSDGCVRSIDQPVIRLMRTAALHSKGTFLVFPGGGYRILSVAQEGEKAGLFLNAQGFDAAVLEYHIGAGPNTRDQALADALAAWRLLHRDAVRLNLSTGFFGLMGFSAGGHLAARTAERLAESGEQVDDLVLVYPAYLNEAISGGVIPKVLPPKTPTGRLFALIADDDRPEWVKSCEIYAKTWRGWGGETVLHVLSGGGHGFGQSPLLDGPLAQFLAAAPCTPPPVNLATIPVPQPGMQLRHAQKVAAAAQEKFDLILIGDSITHSLETPAFRPVWNQYFRHRHVLDLGYSGARTENILWNITHGELDGQSPKVITVMIGTNNVDERNYPTRHTAPQLAGGIAAVVKELRARCPASKILLLGCFPGSYDGALPTSHRLILERTNEIIAHLADGRHVYFLNINAAFLTREGAVDHDLMSDYLHPNPRGAKVWAEAMEPTLARLLDDAPVPANSALAPSGQLEQDGYDWLARHEAACLAGQRLDPDLVFIGDSITHAWGGEPVVGARNTGAGVLGTVLAGHRVLNLGFGWDRTQNVLWRIAHGELDGLRPKAVVVNIGTNNTSETANAFANTPKEIAAGVEAVCASVQNKLPMAKLILMAVLPREKESHDPRRLAIAEVNAFLADYARAQDIDFVDLGPRFLRPDGTLPAELMPDFCHPNASGYRIWAEELLPHLPR